jgi:hypothetical protein
MEESFTPLMPSDKEMAILLSAPAQKDMVTKLHVRHPARAAAEAKVLSSFHGAPLPTSSNSKVIICR